MTENHIPTPKELALAKLAHVDPHSVDRAVEEHYPREFKDGGHARPYTHRGNYKTTQVLESRVVHIHPAVMKLALEMAGNDRARLELCPDGGVIVWNHRNHPRSKRDTAARLRAEAWERQRKAPVVMQQGTFLEVVAESNRAIKAHLDRPKNPSRKGNRGGSTPKLTPAQVNQLIEDRASMKIKELCEKYGLGPATVHRYLAKARKEN